MSPSPQEPPGPTKPAREHSSHRDLLVSTANSVSLDLVRLAGYLRGEDLHRRVVAQVSEAMAVSLIGKDLKYGARAGLCGTPLVADGAMLLRSSTGGHSRLIWSQSCARTQLCTRCAQTIFNKRHRELSTRIRQAQDAGEVVVLATFTVPHRHASVGQTVRTTLEAWTKLVTGGGWRTLKTRHQIVGVFRAIEPTFVDGGCHPHVHALLFLAPDSARCLVQEPSGTWRLPDLRDDLFQRWHAELIDRGLTPHPIKAVDAKIANAAPEEIAGYVLNSLLGPPKADPAHPGPSPTTKDARSRSANALYALDDLRKSAESGSSAARLSRLLQPLLDWLAATAGRKLFTSTAGLFGAVKGAGPQKVSTADRITLRGETARWVHALGREALDDLLDIEPNAAALTRELDRLGLAYEIVDTTDGRGRQQRIRAPRERT